MSAIERCRTAALGGHVMRCENDACAYTAIAYNNCRNRHCPKCQGATAREWMAARAAKICEGAVIRNPSQTRTCRLSMNTTHQGDDCDISSSTSTQWLGQTLHHQFYVRQFETFVPEFFGAAVEPHDGHWPLPLCWNPVCLEAPRGLRPKIDVDASVWINLHR
jgi:hypothetical protein